MVVVDNNTIEQKLASTIEWPGPQTRKRSALLSGERSSKQKKRVERGGMNLCTANKREIRVEREKSGLVHFRKCDRRGLKPVVWGFMAKRVSFNQYICPMRCTDLTRTKRVKCAGAARIAETRKGENGSEVKGACRCREIPLSVPCFMHVPLMVSPEEVSCGTSPSSQRVMCEC